MLSDLLFPEEKDFKSACTRSLSFFHCSMEITSFSFSAQSWWESIKKSSDSSFLRPGPVSEFLIYLYIFSAVSAPVSSFTARSFRSFSSSVERPAPGISSSKTAASAAMSAAREKASLSVRSKRKLW